MLVLRVVHANYTATGECHYSRVKHTGPNISWEITEQNALIIRDSILDGKSSRYIVYASGVWKSVVDLFESEEPQP